MRKIPSLWIGVIGCGIFAVFFFFGPYLPKVDPEVTPHPYVIGPESNLDYMMPPFPPNSDLLLGSDKKGRDIYSALVMGTRKTLEVVISVSLRPIGGLFESYYKLGIIYSQEYLYSYVWFSYLPFLS